MFQVTFEHHYYSFIHLSLNLKREDYTTVLIATENNLFSHSFDLRVRHTKLILILIIQERW